MRGFWLSIAMAAAPCAALAQLRLPSLPLPALPVQNLPQTLDSVDAHTLDQSGVVRRLEISRLIRANRRTLEADPNGDAVVRGEILALAPSDAALERARALGFRVNREQSIAALDLRLVVLDAPNGESTRKALRRLREADPGGRYDYNHLYGGAGALAPDALAPATASPPAQATAAPRPPIRVGLLDTGIDVAHPAFRDAVVHTWGCGGAQLPAAHGTAVASLLLAHAKADLFAADVYCAQPTGGAVDAIVAAMGWLTQQQVPVINVSLVGPKNALLEATVSALIAHGVLIVAAVGNDGPAAPPLYPASYPQVVGVTAVDSQRRVLLEAARGPQVMFAARGADMTAANTEHGYSAVRGTSFAAPAVAALLAGGLPAPDPSAAQAAIRDLARQAIDLGPPGRDLTYGFGLVGADSGP